MADNVVRNDPLDFDNQSFEAGLEDGFVNQTIGETKTRTLKSLLLGGTAVGRVLDILGLREQNPSEMVEQLEKYRVNALSALNDEEEIEALNYKKEIKASNDNDISNDKVEEKKAA